MTSTYDQRVFIKRFVFEESIRSEIAFSDVTKIRLSPERNRILLKADADGLFPVNDTGAYVTTWTTAPAAWLSWIAFESITVEKKNFENDVLTSYYFRLHNGTNEYYWTGAAWIVSTTQWNTEAEINAGLSSWSSSTIGIVVNPRTSDEDTTPEVLEVKLSYYARIDLLRDVVVSFMNLLRDGFRSWRQHVLKTTAIATSIDLSSDFPPELDLSISDVLAVYNHDDDPAHATNLLSSWAPPVVNLTAPIPANKRVWIDLEYAPRVEMGADVDYFEVSKIPAIWIEDLFISSTRGFHRDHVLRRDTNIAHKYEKTRVGDVEVLLSIEAPYLSDHLRLAGQAEGFFDTVRTLNAVGLDEDYDVDILESYGGRSGPDTKGRLSLRYRVRIRNVLLAATAVQRYGIQRMNLDIEPG
jgi:hypothetical protein